MADKGMTKLKILVIIQMVAVIALILFVLISPTSLPAVNVLIITYVSLEALSTILYYIAVTRLKSALESASEEILREYLNSTDQQQKNERS